MPAGPFRFYEEHSVGTIAKDQMWMMRSEDALCPRSEKRIENVCDVCGMKVILYFVEQYDVWLHVV